MYRTAAFLSTFFAVVGDRFDGRKKDRGATAVEYGLLVGLIAVAIIVVLVVLGPQLAQLFNGVSKALPTVTPTP